MKKGLRNGLLAAATTGLLLGTVATVSAQNGQFNQASDAQLEQVDRRGDRGGNKGARGQRGGQRGGGFGLPGVGRVAEGTTVTATFYDGNPEEGAAVLGTQNITVGVDSERTFAQNTREAMQGAAFMVVSTSAQSRTMELPTANAEDADTEAGNKANRGLRGLSARGLTEGSSVEVIFYDADPATDAAVLSTHTFTAGVDSELAFQNAVREAADGAAFVTVNTSAQERSIDLSQMRERFDGRRGGSRGLSPDAPQQEAGPNT